MNQRLNARPPLKRRRHSTFLHVIRDLMRDPLSAVCLLFVALLILVVIFYLGREILDGLVNYDSVSQVTHIVGGVCGMVFGFSLKGSKRG